MKKYKIAASDFMKKIEKSQKVHEVILTLLFIILGVLVSYVSLIK